MQDTSGETTTTAAEVSSAGSRDTAANTKKKRNRTCCCSNPETCVGLTAAFRILEDPRKRFVRIPHYSSRKSNKVREAFLKHILPHHAPLEKDPPTRYIAAHHFHPILSSQGDVPRTLAKQQAERLGLGLTETMFDEELLTRVYIVVPNYPLEQAKEDLAFMLNQILEESGDEEAESVSSDEDMLQATVRVKAVQQEAAACGGEKPPTDMEQAIYKPFHDQQQYVPLNLTCPETKPEPTYLQLRASPPCKQKENGAAEVQAEDSLDLFYGDLPDSLFIVSISGIDNEEEEEKKNAQVERAESSESLSKVSTRDERQERCDSDPERPPVILRAQSEPILHCTERTESPFPRGILRHSFTDASLVKERASPQHHVKFGMINVREYPIMPGDNPGGICGPPLTMDWVHQGKMTAKVEEYEQARPPRRSQAEFSIPANVRKKMLRNSGYTMRQIQRATKLANTVRNQRKSTAGFNHMYAFNEAKERWTLGLSNATINRTGKEKERDYIQNSLKLRRSMLEKEGSQSSLTDGSYDSDTTITHKSRDAASTSSKLSSICCLKP